MLKQWAAPLDMQAVAGSCRVDFFKGYSAINIKAVKCARREFFESNDVIKAALYDACKRRRTVKVRVERKTIILLTQGTGKRAMLTQATDQVAKDKYAAARAAAQALPKKLFINNQFVDGTSGSKLPVVDPRTGETILEIAEGDTEDVDRAVHAASEAFNEGPWPKTAAQVLWSG